MHYLLSDPAARTAHIAAISTLVQTHGWAGVDLDYEALRSADRDAYSGFIRDLSEALRQAHKRLSVTVHAKTSEPGDWTAPWLKIGRH